MGLRTPNQVKADSLWQAFDPSARPFLSACLLPSALNPYDEEGIDLYAIVLRGLPHSKAVPAHHMLWKDYVSDVYAGKEVLVVPSSGNTVHAVARLAPAYGLRVKAVMNTDVPDTKTGILRAFGRSVDVLQVADVEATAQEEAAKPKHHLLDQYNHSGNPESHKRFTGPGIIGLVGRGVLAGIAVPLGSTGTAVGLSHCFVERKLDTRVIGVRPLLGVQVPGARDADKIRAVVKFAWEPWVPHVEEVARRPSFAAARALWSAVEPQPGPTSGMAYLGLLQYLKRLGFEGRAEFRTRCFAFFCPDDARFYTPTFLSELDPGEGVRFP